MSDVPSYTAHAKVIVDHIAPMLKTAGFRKRRHASNRKLDNGLIHQFSLCLMSATGSGHGTAYFHAGCYVPASDLFDQNGTDPKWINDGLCNLRWFFNYDKNGAWTGNFSVKAMAQDPSKAQAFVGKALHALESAETPEQIMALEEEPKGVMVTPRLGILQCCMAQASWNQQQASERLSRYLKACMERENRNLGHESLVAEWGKELGLL